MRGLLPQLVLRVLAAGLLTVVAAAGWVLWDTASAARQDAQTTATLVSD
ncbi:MAG: integral rane sensor signal transduction histidine kinase, partial [Microvirga sp.]|nr:integral rane sensor signal transduction histidine kinase [Microvirga sp.]